MNLKEILKHPRKIVSLLLCASILLQESALAVPASLSIVSAPSAEALRAAVNDADWPAHWGSIDERWAPAGQESSQPRVYLIQDAHGQEEAQKSAAMLLEHLDRQGRLGQVLIEGGSGELDPERLRFFEEDSFNRKAAAFLMSESEIGGAELFLVSRNPGAPPLRASGLEEPALYLRNLEAYQEVYTARPSSEKLLEQVVLNLHTEASRVFSRELYRFFKAWSDFEKNSVPLAEEMDRLAKDAEEFLQFDWKDPRLQIDWPMIVRYREVKLRARRIGAESEDAEEKLFLQWTRQNLGPEAFEELGLFLGAQGNGQNRREFWENFYLRASPLGFSFDQYPGLFLREGMKVLSSELEGSKLMAEIGTLRGKILSRLARSSREKEILRAFQDYLLLKKLILMTLTRDEFDRLNERFRGFKKVPDVLRPQAQKAAAFYRMALERDEAMAERVQAALKDDGQEKSAAVIAGGFHRRGLTEKFREAGLSYAVVSPHFAEIQDGRKYEEAMTGSRQVFDFSQYLVRAANWMNVQGPGLPQQVLARRRLLEWGILRGGAARGATPRRRGTPSALSSARSELRAGSAKGAPWNLISELYADWDLLTGAGDAVQRKNLAPALAAFIRLADHENEARQMLGEARIYQILISDMKQWLTESINKVTRRLVQETKISSLKKIEDFGARHGVSREVLQPLEQALKIIRSGQRRSARKARERSRPLPYAQRDRGQSVRAYVSANESNELLVSLGAERLEPKTGDLSRLRMTLKPEQAKSENPWIPMAHDAVKLGIPKSLLGMTIVLEERLLPKSGSLRQIRVYREDAKGAHYLFSFMESETLGFSRNDQSLAVSKDYTFSHPEFPGETFWVLTTQNFDIQKTVNRFRVITDQSGSLIKVLDGSGSPHPVYEVYDPSGQTRLGFFVMRMDGFWTPSEKFRGIVKGFPLGRERSQRGPSHDTAYIPVPGKKRIAVAPGSEGIKKAEIHAEGRQPTQAVVDGRAYPLILKRDREGRLVDVARIGFYNRLGKFTGTITRFKANRYGRASLGAPFSGIQVGSPSKGGVWMSAAFVNGVIVRTDEWRELPPENPYSFESRSAMADEQSSSPTLIELRRGAPRPKKTHEFIVLRNFRGEPLSSFKLRIPASEWKKHSGLLTGVRVRARSQGLGRLLIQGREYHLPAEYAGHPVTVLRFSEEQKLIFIIHSKTGKQIRDALLYESGGREFSGSYREAAALEKEFRKRSGYSYDLSNIWRQKLASQKLYEEGFRFFQRGELDDAEAKLRQVSLKARRYHRLAQQILQVWIPSRRQIMASGDDRKKRRLLAQWERARHGEEPPARSELRGVWTPENNIWVREGAISPHSHVTLESIRRAQKMLRHFWSGLGEIEESALSDGKFQVPLVENSELNDLMRELTGLKNRYFLYYLPELPEGSFKPYLAADFLDRFFDDPPKLSRIQMVVAESTGNQGKAVASLVQKLKKHPDYAPYADQLKAVIFVPKTANPEKVKAMKALGAAVVNRQFTEEELLEYVKADETARARMDAETQAPYFEGYKDASAYVSKYAGDHPESSHYIRHGAPMGVAAYAVIMLESLDQWYRMVYKTDADFSSSPVSSADFDQFVSFVRQTDAFSKVRFWVPGGSGGLGSGLSQVKLIRPDVQVFLTQVPGVDHVFQSLKAGRLIPKHEAVFDPEALRFVDGIAATAEPTTYEVIGGMADAVMNLPHADNNAMARLMLNLGIRYKKPVGGWAYFESEVSCVLPLTNAVYGGKFSGQLPALKEGGKHILIPITGRTLDPDVEKEIRDLYFYDAWEKLLEISGMPNLRSELRTGDQAEIIRKSVRPGDEGRVSEYLAILQELGLEVREGGRLTYRDDYQPLEMKYNLLMIPHGVTDANERGVFHGGADSRDENLLNTRGKAQVVKGAQKIQALFREHGWPIAAQRYFRSPLRRADETAKLSLQTLQRDYPGLNPRVVELPMLQEISFGAWDGRSLREVSETLGYEESQRAESYRALNALMRAESGENFLLFFKRVRDVLADWNKEFSEKTVVPYVGAEPKVFPKTLFVYGHGTFGAAIRVLMKRPEALDSSGLITWRDAAVPARGEPDFFGARSELRKAGDESENDARNAVAAFLAFIFATEDAALAARTPALPAAVRSQPAVSLPAEDIAALRTILSYALKQGGKAVLPAQAFLAMTPEARQLYAEVFANQGMESTRRAAVFIAGEGAAELKQTFFTQEAFQRSGAASRLFEISAQNEWTLAERMRGKNPVAVSLTGDDSATRPVQSVPAFLVRPEQIRELAPHQQARLMVRMTLLQLLAAVELKGQPADQAAGFLGRAGIVFSISPGGILAPSFQSLLSESLAARLAAFTASAKSA